MALPSWFHLPFSPMAFSSDRDSMIWSAMVFTFVFAVVAVGRYFRFRRQQLWHETARIALEKGQPVPPGMAWGGRWNRGYRRWCDLRRGMACLAVGLALYFSSPTHHQPWDMILGFLGIAFILFSLIGWGKSDRPSDSNGPAGPV